MWCRCIRKGISACDMSLINLGVALILGFNLFFYFG